MARSSENEELIVDKFSEFSIDISEFDNLLDNSSQTKEIKNDNTRSSVDSREPAHVSVVSDSRSDNISILATDKNVIGLDIFQQETSETRETDDNQQETSD